MRLPRSVWKCIEVELESEEGARRVIYILTKINHLNIVKLEGIYNGANPYLVYEFAENGSLRDCLSNKKLDRQLTWLRRMQIAFDLADALHYLHFCTAPAFVHQNINTRNVLITANWRAKISGFRLAKPVISDEEKEDIVWNKHMTPGREAHWTPEYLTNGQASLQVDVFAFGVVLLELISGKDLSRDGKILKDSVRFLFDGAFEDSSHCLEKLKEFMDPVLGGDYSLGDAMCLAFLAKGCMEEDPHHLPTMNHVLKALSRIV
jgi:serine/threonine protein kinase